MNCADIDRLLSEGVEASEVLTHAGASRHLADCPGCRAAFDFLQAPVDVPGIRPKVLADLRPVRPLPGPAVISAAFLVLAAVVVAGSLQYLGLRGWHMMPSWQNALFTVYAVLSCAALLPALVSSMRPGSRIWVPPLLAPLGIVAGHTLFALLYPWNGGTLKVGLQCFTIGLVVGVAAAAVAFMVVRRGYSVNPLVSALLAGAMGSLSAALVLTLFCPHRSANHVVLSHCLAVAALLLIGLLARPVVRRPA